MFKKSLNATVSSSNLERFIEDSDIFNSEFLYKLTLDPDIEREDYKITVNLYRPDLIAKEYYGSTDYESLVILQAGEMSNLYEGRVLKLIPLETLKRIAEKI